MRGGVCGFAVLCSQAHASRACPSGSRDGGEPWPLALSAGPPFLYPVCGRQALGVLLTHWRWLFPNQYFGMSHCCAPWSILFLGQCRMGEEFVFFCFLKRGNGTGDWFSEICGRGGLETDSFKISGFMCAVPNPTASASPGNLLKMQIRGLVSRSALSRPLGASRWCWCPVWEPHRPTRSELICPWLVDIMSRWCNDSFSINIRRFIFVYFGTTIISFQLYWRAPNLSCLMNKGLCCQVRNSSTSQSRKP